MKNVDPVIAEIGSEVLRVMYELKIGVVPATAHVLTQRERYNLFPAVRSAVVDCIQEHEELRGLVVDQLKTERTQIKPVIRYFSFVQASAEAAARIEEEAECQMA